MVPHIVKNQRVFYVHLMSIWWGSTVFIALTRLLQFYSAHIHAFAVQMRKTEFLGPCNPKDSDTMPDDQCPTSVYKNDKRGNDSENIKLQSIIQTWDLVRLFNTLDGDRDGMVSAHDIQRLLEKLGLQYFCDDNMKIIMGFQEHMSFEGFCRLCVSLLEEAQSAKSMQAVYEQEELKEAFSVFDIDGDGFITPSELQEVFRSLGLREGQDLKNCEIIITRFDKNSDGRIDIVEFVNMMTMIKRY